jgi:AcrR family transcriptional regulator
MYRRRPTTQKTRDRVLTTVRELLEEGSFHDSTVEEVAARAGVSRASLYQHFGSRLGLIDSLCDTFALHPALLAIRETDDLDRLLELSVEFWSDQEKVLVQLYGAAAVDPAARDFVERQRRDRHGELKRFIRRAGLTGRSAFTTLVLLTSFETFQELRREAGLSNREVARTLKDAAHRLLSEPPPS